jgi:GNAT superfamily N-acetyltransferase
MAKKHTCKEKKDMQEISNKGSKNISIDELYRYSTECGELQCHRLNIPDGTAGELIINVHGNEKALTIEEVFVDRKFRHMGLGSKLLAFAETIAMASGVQNIELKPFSTDPLVSDHKLREWYMERGYQPHGEKMHKKLNKEILEVMT